MRSRHPAREERGRPLPGGGPVPLIRLLLLVLLGIRRGTPRTVRAARGLTLAARQDHGVDTGVPAEAAGHDTHGEPPLSELGMGETISPIPYGDWQHRLEHGVPKKSRNLPRRPLVLAPDRYPSVLDAAFRNSRLTGPAIMESESRLPRPMPTSSAATAKMRANKRANTKPEIRLRSELHAAGMRFRKDFPVSVPGVRVRPDVVFTRARVAVFLDGCFWHACPYHGDTPRSNTEYWIPKLQRNAERDRLVDECLRAAGWTVLRLWEHVTAEEGLRIVQTAVTQREPR
jgi:DNA mismatch endonuclease (patch repair protein)